MSLKKHLFIVLMLLLICVVIKSDGSVVINRVSPVKVTSSRQIKVLDDTTEMKFSWKIDLKPNDMPYSLKIYFRNCIIASGNSTRFSMNRECGNLNNSFTLYKDNEFTVIFYGPDVYDIKSSSKAMVEHVSAVLEFDNTKIPTRDIQLYFVTPCNEQACGPTLSTTLIVATSTFGSMFIVIILFAAYITRERGGISSTVNICLENMKKLKRQYTALCKRTKKSKKSTTDDVIEQQDTADVRQSNLTDTSQNKTENVITEGTLQEVVIENPGNSTTDISLSSSLGKTEEDSKLLENKGDVEDSKLLENKGDVKDSKLLENKGDVGCSIENNKDKLTVGIDNENFIEEIKYLYNSEDKER